MFIHPLDDSVLHLANAILAPGAIGIWGIFRYYKRRNGNDTASKSDVKQLGDRLEQKIKYNFDNINKRIDEIRSWNDELDSTQKDINKRLAYCEGQASKK